MSMRFMAIGVAQGDAFFLEQEEGHTVLVDGGRSVGGFPAEFQRATNRNGIDVLVCTHNDADHANGIAGFLQAGLRCNEVWVPASWTDRLEDLFLRPGNFTDELVEDVMALDEGITRNREREGSLLEQLGDDYAEETPSNERSETVQTEALLEHTLGREIEEEPGQREWPYPFAWPSRWGTRLLRGWWPGDRRFRLFVESIEAGDRIRQIALLAYHRGCQIRWFEYAGPVASGGSQGKLIPVNAREVLRVRVKKWSALMYLALTITNRQSLVFFSSADNGPGILFTADSDLCFSNHVTWHDGMIITAPHHGSESNAKAYARYYREMPQSASSIWVRSDGRFKSRPGKSYLNLKAARFCTICRGSQQPKQELLFTSSNQQWQPVGTRGCSCK
jgi:Metallo-beta-lactamase superfamily